MFSLHFDAAKTAVERVEDPELVDDVEMEVEELGELDELHLNPVFASPISVSLGPLQPTQYNDRQL
jgi:hypothetical protein